MRVYVQSISRLSVPVQRTSSRWMGPLPCPKKAKEKATAPVYKRRKEYNWPYIFRCQSLGNQLVNTTVILPIDCLYVDVDMKL